GDCLWKIAKMKYGNPYLWPAIWDANRDGVVNKDQLTNRRHKAVTNPNLIYPGQVLRIPSLTDAQKKEAEMRAHSYRGYRKRKTTTTETKKEEPKKEAPKKEEPKK
ncbi:MAG: LysM peptidoglycan-binding domain-containing protein, partial [Ignavibacteria bacterium]